MFSVFYIIIVEEYKLLVIAFHYLLGIKIHNFLTE